MPFNYQWTGEYASPRTINGRTIRLSPWGLLVEDVVDAPGRPAREVIIASTRDDSAERFRGWLNGSGINFGPAIRRGPRNAAQEEIARFSLDYPTVGPLLRTALNIADDASGVSDNQVFQVASTYRVSNDLVKLGIDPQAECREFVFSHTCGDFGAIGNLEDASLDDDQRWLSGTWSTELNRNAIVLERGVGLVRSRYLIYREDVDAATGQRRPNDYACVVTHLASGETYVFSSREQQLS